MPAGRVGRAETIPLVFWYPENCPPHVHIHPHTVDLCQYSHGLAHADYIPVGTHMPLTQIAPSFSPQLGSHTETLPLTLMKPPSLTTSNLWAWSDSCFPQHPTPFCSIAQVGRIWMGDSVLRPRQQKAEEAVPQLVWTWKWVTGAWSPLGKGLVAKPREFFRGIGVRLSHYCSLDTSSVFFINGVGLMKSVKQMWIKHRGGRIPLIKILRTVVFKVPHLEPQYLGHTSRNGRARLC